METIPSLGPTASASAVSTDLPTNLTNIGTQIIGAMLVLAAVIAVLYLIYSGYKFISVGGDPEKAKTARSSVIGAVIGVVIIVLAYTIVQFAINLGWATGGLIK